MDSRKPPLLILDANVWLSRQFLMLSTPIGASLLLSIQRRGGFLGLPEVLEGEIRKNAGDMAVKYAERFEEAALILNDLGVRQRDQPPLDTSAIRQAAVNRLDVLRPFFVPMPLTIEQVRRALLRVNAEQPPSGAKNQQFKDSVIWESVLDASARYSPIFVTGDKGFFDNRDPRRGPADCIRSDAKRAGVALLATHQIPDLLTSLSEGLPSLESIELKRVLISSLRPRMEEFANRSGVQLLEQDEFEVTTYLTEVRSELAVDFRLRYRALAGSTDDGAIPAGYALEGGCRYSFEKRALSELTIYGQSAWLESHGPQDLKSVSIDMGNPPKGYQGPRVHLDNA